MNTEFTPGTWHQTIRQPGTMLTIEGENGDYVCSLLGGDERKQANARLIAQAPRLLQALIGTMRTLRMQHGIDCNCNECVAANEAVTDATS